MNIQKKKKEKELAPSLHRIGFTASAFSHPIKTDLDGWKVNKRENNKQCN